MALKTTEQFIKEAKAIHVDRYDYSLVDYKRCDIHIKIICKTHGAFEQSPNSHLNNRGCPNCGFESRGLKFRLTRDEFIRRSSEKHSNKYNYDLVIYKGNSHKVDIICPKHGVFKQIPYDHSSGKGCNKCAYELKRIKITKSQDEILKRFKDTHGDRYCYKKVKYKSGKGKVIITCLLHGDFEQESHAHSIGQGCPKCGRKRIKNSAKENPSGWSVSNWNNSAKKSKWFDSFKVYVIKCWNDDEEFYKVGRTFLTTQRRFRNVAAMPYNYSIIKEFIFNNPRLAFDKEIELKTFHKEFKYKPKIRFNGMNECFSKQLILNG